MRERKHKWLLGFESVARAFRLKPVRAVRKRAEWGVIGQSVRGASHIRKNLENQDAIKWKVGEVNGLPLTLAIADGHGDHRSFRSRVGADLAAAIAVELLGEFVSQQTTSNAPLSTLKRTAEERLAEEYLRRWRMAVEQHLKEHPLSAKEKALAVGDSEAANFEVKKYRVYGSTILIATIGQWRVDNETQRFIIYARLGDGDILAVSEEGEVQYPLPEDQEFIANETLSLSQEKAWHNMQVRFQALPGVLPALLLLCTDGYINSFENRAEFEMIGPDLLEMLRYEGGIEAVDANLADWLNEASQLGSGDDTTLGIIYRTSALTMPRNPESKPSVT